MLPELGVVEGVAEPLGAAEEVTAGLPDAEGLSDGLAVGCPVALLASALAEQEVRASPKAPRPRGPMPRSTPRRVVAEWTVFLLARCTSNSIGF